MKKTILYFLAIFLILLNVTSSAQSVDKLIDDAEKYYKEFNNEKALDALKKAEKIDPTNYDVLWLLSRTYVDIADRMPANNNDQEEAQLKTFQSALEYADKAVKKDGSKSAGLLRRAIANGKIALFKGVFSVAGVVNSVKADVEKAIQLNNGGNFVQGVAHYVLGRTHARTSEKWKPARSVLGLGWADNEIALKEFKKAIEIYPGYMMFYVDYANSLIREDEYDLARQMLNKAISCQFLHQDDEKRLAEAKKLLAEIKNQ